MQRLDLALPAPRVGICSAEVEREGLKFDVNRTFSLTLVFPADF